VLRSFEIPPCHDWDRHCINVGDIAFKLALEISKYKEIDPERVRVMGLVHDFGRSVTHDPYRHAYEGHRLMKKLGYPALARICTCHSNGTFKMEDLDEYGLLPQDFFVSNLEEILVFIGDSIEYRGGMIRHDKRILETVERYKEKNPEFIPVLLSKLKEFEGFDHQIKEIIGRGIYDFFAI
jgi:hypothetical protein